MSPVPLAEAHALIGRTARHLEEVLEDALSDPPKMDTGLEMFLLFGAVAVLLIVGNIIWMCVAAFTPETPDSPGAPILPPPPQPKPKAAMPQMPRANSRQKVTEELSEDLEEGGLAVKGVKSSRKSGKKTKEYTRCTEGSRR
jgi:hypothetical protein